MDRIAIEPTAVVVLAEAGSTAELNDARGRLFEVFVAKLLDVQGYSEPRVENLNVTVDGIEIDVVARHRVTQHTLMAECKCYSASISARHVTSFIGKLALARADDPNVVGLFVGIPRLTANAHEQAKDATEKFSGFRALGSQDVLGLLVQSDLLPPLTDGPHLQSDLTVVVTEHGLVLAARELDERTRRATRLVVWRKGGVVPEPVIELVQRHVAEGLPVAQISEEELTVPTETVQPPTIVAVRGSSSDFEYQLPAGPEFFVGRRAITDELISLVRDRQSSGVVVVNAKSGWGKSSLALRLGREVERVGGAALVVDTRTAERKDFVAAALEALVKQAEESAILWMPEDASYGSLTSTVRSLQRARWLTDRGPLLIVFDQFENVFRDEPLTREFRDLAILIREVEAPVTVGFSWKTDLVGWTEDHPYRLRDEIRSAADVIVLEPFGPREVETLLRRLEKAVGGKLDRDIRRRLRELSQGLPWLFKKLASHIKSEVERGATQEELVRASLNVQALFESDLAELSPKEQEGLRTIARTAPSLISELEEAVPTQIVQSLLNRRLIVQVGSRIDTYWDTFRDFLLTGQVAIEDSYMIRYGPVSGVPKLLRAALAAGGDLPVPAAAEALATSPNVIWNFTRELRQFGLVAPEPNRIVVDPAIVGAADREAAIRARVASALRRHKISSVATRLVDESGGTVPLARLADELPGAFPTVEANSESWLTYARAFAQWLGYAGLFAFTTRDGLSHASDDVQPTARLLSGAVPIRVRSAFPQGPAGPAEQLLRHIVDPSTPAPKDRRRSTALRDLSLLGVVELDEQDRVTLSDGRLMAGGALRRDVLRLLVEHMPGASDALDLLAAEPAASPARIGAILRGAHGAEWKEAHTQRVGKHFRSWARACGVSTALRATQPLPASQGDQLQVEYGVPL